MIHRSGPLLHFRVELSVFFVENGLYGAVSGWYYAECRVRPAFYHLPLR